MLISTFLGIASSSFLFENYTQDRPRLMRLLELCKEHRFEHHLNQDATSMDELLTDNFIPTFLMRHFQGDDAGLIKVGEVLGDMHPGRMDTILSSLFDHSEGPNTQLTVISGYPNGESLWKRASNLPNDTPLTAENAIYHLSHENYDEYCDLMRNSPVFISPKCLLECLYIWEIKKEYELIRIASIPPVPAADFLNVVPRAIWA